MCVRCGVLGHSAARESVEFVPTKGWMVRVGDGIENGDRNRLLHVFVIISHVFLFFHPTNY